jgi:hypothetical protein
MKRRPISLLPVVHQTTALTRFFGSTVDHLFQPGASEPVSGYIGRKPYYYNAATDFYKQEINDARQNYQLETAMVSSTNGQVTDLMFYDDLINRLAKMGSNTDNIARLFETDYYSWAPPIDIDKVTFFQKYYWADSGVAVLTLTAPGCEMGYYANGDGFSTHFALAPKEAAFSTVDENPKVLVDGVLVTNWSRLNEEIVFQTPPADGTTVTIYRYGNVGNGSNTLFPIAPLVDGYAAQGLFVYMDTVEVQSTDYSVVGDSIQFTTAPPSGAHIIVSQYKSLKLAIEGRVEADVSGFNTRGVHNLINGMRVKLVDPTTMFIGFDIKPYDTFPWDEFVESRFSVEGVGLSIELVTETDALPSFDPYYVVIDRRSRERSFWSRVNRWVPREALAWSGDDTPERRAKRPIVEFLPNIALHNYGTRRLDRIDAAITQAPIVSSAAIDYKTINGRSYKSVTVDGGTILTEGQRLLIAIPNDDDAYNNLMYRVSIVEQSPDVFVYLLETLTAPEEGDIVQLNTTTTEYFFMGGVWQLAATPGDHPLFELYDSDGVALSDVGVYPTTNFHGSKIFSYAVGTGRPDAILNIPLKHDPYGQIIFENYEYTQRFTYRDGDIDGYYYYQRDFVFENQWLQSSTTLPFSTDKWAVPLNLQANPDFDDVHFISRNGFYAQFSSIMANQEGFTGEPFLDNNWQSTVKDYSKGLCILQHHAPLLRLMLLLSKDEYSPKAAIQYAEQEYVRFKLKFIHKINNWLLDGTITAASATSKTVDRVLDDLKLSKSSEFAFAISTIGGRNDFIPPTPATLGIRPLVRPVLTTDNDGNVFVRGHDGSLVSSNGSFVDGLLLALETRIYNSASNMAGKEPLINIAELTEARYRAGEYSREELNNIMIAPFENWARRNKVNYRANTTFNINDPWTYNYSDSLDRYGRKVPGNWRGIYLWYFDTITPNLTPWEMLGFSEEPTWWAGEYGEAPYTRDNAKLWADLEIGRIRQGSRAGTNSLYARPNLMQVLPIDDYANLLDPIQATIIPTIPALQFARKDWRFGDGSDVEFAWMRSSAYGFAQALTTFLMKPARFVETYWDGNRRLVHADQWVDATALLRQHCADMVVHRSFREDGTQKEARGIEHWIIEYVFSTGRTQSNFEIDLHGIEPRLAHKMGGFTTKDRMTVVAEHFGLVPDEDVTITLYASPSTGDHFYSGMVIEKTDYGFRVIGYDPEDPFFDMLLPDRGGRRASLFRNPYTDRVINPWSPNVYYKVGQWVEHNGSQYQAQKNHQSALVFEEIFWTLDNYAPPVPQDKLVKYLETSGETARFAYGDEVRSRQEVIDIIYGYERWLVQSGFDFTDGPSWDKAVEDFYNWSNVHWTTGAFIALSPSANELRFNSEQGYVLNLETQDSFTGVIYDKAGQPVDPAKATIDRYDTYTIIRDANVYGARLRTGEVEHVLIFSNETIFGDIIYDPLLNIRQERMKLSARRTQDWTGRYDAPGFIINGDQVVSNYAKSADDIKYMFDIELADNTILRDHARHLIGFQQREYLDQLELSETQQFELYQGMIQAKGTGGSFEKLLRSTKIGFLDSDLRFLEEVGFRLADYGAYKPRAEIELLLSQSDLHREPQIISLVDSGHHDWLVYPSNSPNWLQDAPDFTDLMVSGRPTARLPFPDAGYVRTDEATYFYINSAAMKADFTQRYKDDKTFSDGEMVWTYGFDLKGFNVQYLLNPTVNLHATYVNWFQNHDTEFPPTVEPEVDVEVDAPTAVITLPTQCTIDDDSGDPPVDPPPFIEGEHILGQRLVLSETHNIIMGDTVLICNSLEAHGLGGLQRVVGVGTNWIEIDVDDAISLNRLFTTEEQDIRPQVFKIKGGRVANITERDALPEVMHLKLIYIDDIGSGKWAVQKNIQPIGQTVADPWHTIRSEPLRVNSNLIVSTLLYDKDTKIDDVSIRPEPLVVARINPIDPLAGLIPGIADEKIDFKLEDDPATYAEGNEEVWGPNEVGKVWWNTATTYYLNYYTDNVDGLAPTDAATSSKWNIVPKNGPRLRRFR